jgi:hypothetical protein
VPFLVDYGASAQGAFDSLGTFLPKLICALVILLVGFIIAKVVSKVVARALSGVGADKALSSSSAGAYRDEYLPGMEPSGLIGRMVFWFVFGLAILTAVSALGIQALSDAVASITGYLPNVIAAILILLVAIVVAGAVGALVQRVMGGTMLGKMVQTVVPVLVITIALFMALVQLKIATQIVVATYVLVLGAIALGFALAFGLGGRDVAGKMLAGAYEKGQEKLPQMQQEAAQATQQAASDASSLKEKAQPPSDKTERRI